jgi:hypothetical protein
VVTSLASAICPVAILTTINHLSEKGSVAARLRLAAGTAGRG